MKKLKKLLWLIKNQEKIEKLLEQPKKDTEKSYSISGVPEFQRKYVDKMIVEHD